MPTFDALIIGGSAGSFQVIIRIVEHLSPTLTIPTFVVMHRLKSARHGFVEALSPKSSLPVREPADKERIKPGTIYIAPANYHMLIDENERFSVVAEEPHLHSRPSINFSFITAAEIYQNRLCGILLSGANCDGSDGIRHIQSLGGFTIVQDPATCEVKMMTESALKVMDPDQVFRPVDIWEFIKNL